jgi:hypothetical protein
MKTRLLFLFMVTFSLGNAQINVSEGFESGTVPSGWGNNNFSFTNTTSCSGVYSASFTTSGLGSGAEISTPTYTSTGASITVSVDYKKSSGSGGGIFYLQYYNFTTSSWTTITTTTSFLNTCQTLSATIPAGTIPTGANVAFKFYLYCTSGNFTFHVDNTKVFENIPQTIAVYSFDNTYNNINGNTPFASNAGTSFTTDRHGNSNGAININNSGSNANIAGLSYGASTRSISVWAKTNVLNSTINYVFHYGSSGNGNGLAFRPTTILYFENGGANLELSNTNVNNTWVHYVCTYDGTTAKVYKNGVLFSSGAKTFNTANNLDIFKLGTAETGAVNYFNGAIDDLKIYNYVLTDAEVTNLYTNNSLTSENFNANNLEVGLYPNPVNDILNIDTKEEILSVEIFALQGQKVMSSKENKINVAELPTGIYLVRIQDINNNIATKKIIKN